VQGTPLLRDLGTAAPQMARLIRGLGTFSEASNEALPSLGDALETGRPDLIRAQPLIRKLNSLGKEAKPAVSDLDKLTASLKDTEGVQRINDFLYYLTLSVNGYDSLGHYLRAGLVATATCSNRAIQPATTGTCWALFFDPQDDSEAASASAGAAKTAKLKPDAPKSNSLIESLVGSPEATKQQQRQAQQEMEQLRQRAKKPSAALQTDEPVLDYLLGGDK
jgi:hypothetical protein